MADPVLDENLILQLLTAPASGTIDDIGRLQAAAIQALTDMHDRKMTRDQYIQHAASAVSLYGQLCKLWMLLSMKEAFNNGDFDAARIAEAEHGLLNLVNKQVKTVHGIVTELMKCPTSQDVVH